jgi:hypothetical protein
MLICSCSGNLHDRAEGPFHVLRRISENFYEIDLPGDMSVSTTFNVADLQAFNDDKTDDQYSRTSPFQAEETDAGAFSDTEEASSTTDSPSNSTEEVHSGSNSKRKSKQNIVKPSYLRGNYILIEKDKRI